jgi:outer membrane receptor protein involved in Fe transport
MEQERLVYGLGIALCTGVAFAQDIVQLPTIEVIGNYENAVGTSDAASQGVVTPKMFENRPILRPGEVLETVPGLIITQHSGDGKANQYFLRGYNLDHGTDFATWVAGMPINMPTHAHGQGYTDLNFLIPELISRVDYHKGTYFAEDGDFASVGSARVSYAESLKQSVASVTGGQYGYRRALLAGSPKVGAGQVVYGLEYQHNDGPWDHPADFKKYNGVLRYAQGDLGNGFNVTGMAYKADWDSTDQIPQRAVDQGIIGRFGSLDTSDGGKQRRYSLSTQWRTTNESGKTAISAYAIRSKLNLFSNFTFFLDHPFDLGDPVNGDQFEQAENRTVLGGEGKHTWFGKLGGKEMTNTLGVQLRRDRLQPVALYSNVKRERVATTREDNVTESSAGIYYQNTLQWTNWFRSIAGIRADYYRFKVNSNTDANSGSKGDHLFSPKLSLIFGPWAKTEYFVNAGRGFHSNDARGTTISVDPKTGDPAEKVTPLVRTVGAEIGARTQIVPNVQTSVALWRLKQDSELLFVGDAGVTEASRPSLRTGFELDCHYIPRPWLIFDFNFATTRARFDDNDPSNIGTRIPGAIERVISAGLTIDSINGWFGALEYRYFGPRPLIDDNSARSRSTILTNARVGYKFAKNWSVRLDVFNLFNREADDITYFYASRLKGEPPEGGNDFHFHPAETRSLRVTLAATF